MSSRVVVQLGKHLSGCLCWQLFQQIRKFFLGFTIFCQILTRFWHRICLFTLGNKLLWRHLQLFRIYQLTQLLSSLLKLTLVGPAAQHVLHPDYPPIHIDQSLQSVEEQPHCLAVRLNDSCKTGRPTLLRWLLSWPFSKWAILSNHSDPVFAMWLIGGLLCLTMDSDDFSDLWLVLLSEECLELAVQLFLLVTVGWLHFSIKIHYWANWQLIKWTL